jgi:hypothetical protein
MNPNKILLAIALAFAGCCEEQEDFQAVLIEKQNLQKKSGESVGYLLSFKNKANTVQKAKVFDKWGTDIQVGDFVKGSYNCGEIKVTGFEPRPK